jgi:hypothetical protein
LGGWRVGRAVAVGWGLAYGRPLSGPADDGARFMDCNNTLRISVEYTIGAPKFLTEPVIVAGLARSSRQRYKGNATRKNIVYI